MCKLIFRLYNSVGFINIVASSAPRWSSWRTDFFQWDKVT